MASSLEDIFAQFATEEHRIDAMASGLRGKRWWAAVTISFGVIVMFLVVAMLTNNSHWISRAGALITFIGIVLTADGLRHGHLEGPVRAVVTDIFAKFEREQQKAGDEPTELAIAKSRIEPQVERLFQGVAKKVASQNLLLAAVGTLVWGFGDLTPVHLIQGILP